MLIFRLDICIVAVISFFMLLNLPRALIRLSRFVEWTQGIILRTIDIEYQRQRRLPVLQPWSPTSSGKKFETPSDDSHVMSLPARRTNWGILPPSYPSHLAAWPAFARPLAWIVRYRVSPGFSLGQFVILVVYSSAIAFGSFCHSNPITNPNRFGWLAVSQMPFLFAFATKNNLLGMMVGKGYEKVNSSSCCDIVVR
jgi:hypothetical protein